MTETINVTKAQEILNAHRAKGNGRIFTVTFIKRTTGETRVMNARFAVKKHLKGGERAYDFEKKNVIGVFDVQKGGYRVISVEGITGMKVDGNEYEVKAS